MIAFLLAISLSAMAPSIAVGAPDMSVSDREITQAQESVNQSKASLEKAQSRLKDLSDKTSALKAEVESIAQEIEDAAEQAKKAQSDMLDGRDALSEAMLYEYKNDTISSYLQILLGSNSLGELTDNMGYIGQVMDHHSSEIRRQKRLRKKLDDITVDLNQKLDAQEIKLKEMKDNEEEAQSLVDNLTSELGSKNKKLKDLQAYAESVRRANEAASTPKPKEQQTNQGLSPDKNEASSKPPTPADPDDGAGDDDSDSSEWKSGSASAYGGSSDKTVKNPARTATGAICNDSSMGVAVPMAWSNYKNLFGHTVVIKYGGRTVYATINDCGGLGGGSRHLDLQPGVFKALGFKTCQAWGVRTVKYRIL